MYECRYIYTVYTVDCIFALALLLALIYTQIIVVWGVYIALIHISLSVCKNCSSYPRETSVMPCIWWIYLLALQHCHLPCWWTVNYPFSTWKGSEIEFPLLGLDVIDLHLPGTLKMEPILLNAAVNNFMLIC